MIKNRLQLINLSRDLKQKIIRRRLLDILDFSLKQSDPYFLTVKFLKRINFRKYKRIFVVGAGKGTYRMALAAEKFLGKRLSGGRINVPEKIKDGVLKKIKITLAGHPFPNNGSVLGAHKIISLIQSATEDDLILGLFSGGASALMCLPVVGVDLLDKIKTTELLLKSGANIDEINTVRKHLSQIKGGWLAEISKNSNLLSFYLSDVVGDDLSTIASGPTVSDKTTFAEALKVFKKYSLVKKLSDTVRHYLEEGSMGLHLETPKKISLKVKNIIIGSHKTLAQAAFKKARDLGFAAKIMTDDMVGETTTIGEVFIKRLYQEKSGTVLIAAGETNFKVKTRNPGGRNQQMGLAVLAKLKSNDFFLAFDSDGVDGIGLEKVGGVLMDYGTFEKAQKLKLDIKKALKTNDSYIFFKRLNCQIKTGYVGTNLGDIVILCRYQH